MEEKQIIKLKLALDKSIQESISFINSILSNREKILLFFKENLNLEFDKILDKRKIKDKLKQLSLLKENVNPDNDSGSILKAARNLELKIQLEKLDVIYKEFSNENQKLKLEIARENQVKQDKKTYCTQFTSQILGMEKVNELEREI